MEERLDATDISVAGNRAQRRAGTRGKKAAALGSGLVLAAGAASTAVTLASTAPAGADTFTVSTLADSGAGSLRQAILDANSNAGQDVITFSVTGTITLANHLPAIHDALQIQGPGADLLTVDGADEWNMFNFYRVDASDGVNEISGLTITHGHASDSSYNGNFYNNDASGGGIVVRFGSADLTITNAVITDNYAENDGGGVNLYDAGGHVTITNTTISNNAAFYGGGGLYADGTDLTLTIDNVTVTGNLAGVGVDNEAYDGGNGGGLYLDNLDATITNSTVNFNQAYEGNYGDGDGGGIWIENSTASVSNSFVGNNIAGSAGGGLQAGFDTDLSVEFTTITGNQALDSGGGGMKMRDGESTSTLAMRNSTVSNNTAQYYGGGLYLRMYGAATIDNSTISGNSAKQAGGVYAGESGGVTITQSTITDNTATDPYNGTAVGGVQISGATILQGVEARRGAEANGTRVGKGARAAKEAGKKQAHGAGVHAAASEEELDVNGTIISGNAGEDVGVYRDTATVNSNHSLLGTIGTGVTVNDLGGTVSSTDPGLEPLANNGGLTQTHALVVGSQAKDAGPDPVTPFPGNENDQRGAGYPRVVDGRVDIGAFEVQAPQPIDLAPRFTG